MAEIQRLCLEIQSAEIFHKLSGTIKDICILLYASCKRRKEIVNLQIENVNFVEHYVSYTEYKNASRAKCIHKAFFLTSDMETFLKRVKGKRVRGNLWQQNFHPDFLGHRFLSG